MKKKIGLVFLFLLLSLNVTGTAPATEPQAAGKAQTLTVVAITDFHGALEPEAVKTKSGERVESGGASLLSSYVNLIRRKAPGPVIVIDAGDMFQGTMASNLAEGEPVIRFYNHLGVAAAALGNHEFDFGPKGEKSIPMEAGDDPRGALKARIRQARFPILAANVVDDSGRTPSWLRRSVLLTRDGLRIGVIGAATPSTPSTTVRANLVGLRFPDPAPFVAKEARELRARGADVVILTFHGGGSCKGNHIDYQDNLESCDEGEMFRLLRQLPQGLIDVAVGGHTHQGVAKRLGRTAVLQSYSRGKQVGWAEVPIGSPQAKPRVAGFVPVCGSTVETPRGPSCFPAAVTESSGPVRPARFLGEEVRPDAAVEALIAPDLERVRAIKNQHLGVKALTPLTRAYGEESALGNLTADILRKAIPGADIGVTNGGGLRANIPPGPLFYGHIFEVLPFDNRVATMEVGGRVLKRMVELGHAGSHGALSWSKLTFAAIGCDIVSIEVDGKPLRPDAVYRVVTNDYLAGGGSGFDKLDIDPQKIRVLWNGPYILRDVAARMIKEWGQDLDARFFYEPASPRQRITGSCRTETGRR